MRVWSLKTCDTCRKSLKMLREKEYDLEVIDVRLDGLVIKDVSDILAQFGEKALNKSSTTWRQLGEEDKKSSLSELLLTHPTLLKRPVIEESGVWTLGWKTDAQEQWLNKA